MRVHTLTLCAVLTAALSAGPSALAQVNPSAATAPPAQTAAALATPNTPTAQTAAPATPPAEAAPEVLVSNEPVEGTPVQRGRSEIVINAPMEQVVRAMGDFPRYPEFMPRVGESRVIRRNRAVTDVYVQVPLPRSLGVVWSLCRVTTRRSPDRVEMVGENVDGNMERFETHALIERIPGAEPRTRFTFRLLALPRLPLPSSVFTREMAFAARSVATNVRTRVERGFALDGVRSGVGAVTPLSPPPEASTRR